jgi:acetyl-CoA/propionyl-CoA carboxylase, biotin carboxylase, biotin carboxyl carrier protein
VDTADGPQPARAERHDDRLRLTLGGDTVVFHVAREGRSTWLGVDGNAWQIVERPLLAPGSGAQRASSANITSPMPGSVVAVVVAVGDVVRAGQPVVVVEAMKMEHTLRADFDGTVAEVLAHVGDSVALHQLLAVIDTAPATEEP